MSLLDNATAQALQWLDEQSVDSETKKTIHALLASKDNKPLIDQFYKNLEFGTGGLRGIMGVGSNCMNRYTVGAATQGLANYLNKTFAGTTISVAIAYDSRLNSRAFAEVTAHVFSANGITVYLFNELRPTPLLSFAIRYLKCQSGVVITASHNPKEYNGYKAYWNTGAQLVPPHDKNVITEVNAITSFDQIRFTPYPSKIKSVPAEVEDAYYREVIARIPRKDSITRQAEIPLVYSSLHGAGITMVPECLKRLGFRNLHVVEQQRVPDGKFPTVQSPNPEEQSAMAMALQQAADVNADLVMATDPDTDRVGLGIRDDQGNYFLLNGNQAFALMMWFILKNLSDKKDAYIAKTIVTTELIDDMAKRLGVECYNTLTGFKYIAELMNELEGKKKFIAAGEESYGYMVGDFVRDKDAVSACAFFAAMAAAARDDGKRLYDWLLSMYVEDGFYKEGLVNLVRKGADGEQQIKAMMQKFRNDPPKTLGGEQVVRALDYKLKTDTDLTTKKSTPLNFPSSDVLQFYTAEGTKISVRPSGTEPKIKFYVSVKSTLASAAEFKHVEQQLDAKIKQISAEITAL